MKRKAFQIIALQSLGPACLFLYTIYLARVYGPTVQGTFAENKSWIELLVAVGCYGFPQSVILAINRRGASAFHLRKKAFQYALLWLPIFLAGSYYLASHLNSDVESTIFISLGGAALVAAGIWRGIYLTIDAGSRFHWITIAPSVLMVAFTAMTPLLQSVPEETFPVAIGSAGICALLFTSLIFKAPDQVRNPPPLDYKKLLLDGSDVFLQTATGAVQIYIAFAWLRINTSSTEIGHFSTALMVLQILLFPLASLSPIILNYWSKSPPPTTSIIALKKLWKIILPAFLLIGIAVALTPWFAPRIFGPEYTPATSAIQVTLASSLAILAARIVNLRITASGDFRPGTYSAIIKFLMFALGLLALGKYTPSEVDAYHMALVFCIAEVGAAAWLLAVSSQSIKYKES